MKGTHLGELEEMILLIVAALYDEAYGVAVQEAVKQRCNRSITISTVHNVLHRLAEKGFLVSHYAEATKARGGRRKLLFRVTNEGQQALLALKEIRTNLWNSIPKPAFDA